MWLIICNIPAHTDFFFPALYATVPPKINVFQIKAQNLVVARSIRSKLQINTSRKKINGVWCDTLQNREGVCGFSSLVANGESPVTSSSSQFVQQPGEEATVRAHRQHGQTCWHTTNTFLLLHTWGWFVVNIFKDAQSQKRRDTKHAQCRSDLLLVCYLSRENGTQRKAWFLIMKLSNPHSLMCDTDPDPSCYA